MAQFKSNQSGASAARATATSLALIVVLLISIQANVAQAGLFDQLVQTGVSALSPNGRHVSVNLPAIFNMVLDTRGQQGGAKLDMNVLLGLVRVSLDRERRNDGRLHGPIHVSVGGLTMYDDGEGPLPTNGTNSQQQNYTIPVAPTSPYDYYTSTPGPYSSWNQDSNQNELGKEKPTYGQSSSRPSSSNIFGRGTQNYDQYTTTNAPSYASYGGSSYGEEKGYKSDPRYPSYREEVPKTYP